jgi:hypothetical protein
MVLWVGYLVQVGLLMIWLPWSRLWQLIVIKMPASAAWIVDAPALRGAITAFGVLHLVMVLVELIHAGSQENHRRQV